MDGKVYVFQEGHKNWWNLHRQFDAEQLLSKVKISSIFVAFLENMNFTITYVTIGNEANGDPQKADVLLSGVIGQLDFYYRPFIYYVITCWGEGGHKMPIFDYFQY